MHTKSTSLQGMHLFYSERFRGLLRDGDNVTWYWNDRHRLPTEKVFGSDASLEIPDAGSVTGAAIELAFHLGFDPIYLIGCNVTTRCRTQSSRRDLTSSATVSASNSRAQWMTTRLAQNVTGGCCLVGYSALARGHRSGTAQH